MDGKLNETLVKQINNSPYPLRSYIHDLEVFVGNGAHLVQYNFLLAEQNKQLIEYIKLLKDEMKMRAIEKIFELMKRGGIGFFNLDKSLGDEEIIKPSDILRALENGDRIQISLTFCRCKNPDPQQISVDSNNYICGRCSMNIVNHSK